MILCCGEALVDMLPRQLQTGEQAYLPVAGGAIFNTAIALGRLEEPTSFLSGISTDQFGELLVRTLDESGVSSDFAVRSKRPTTLAFVALKDGHARYTFYDEGSAGENVTSDDLPDLPKVEAAHFGAISLIGEPCGAAYEEVAMRLKSDAVISLDPNIRTSFISDEQTYRGRLERMLAVADIIKVSDEDLEWIAQGEDLENLYARWFASGTKIIVLTKGSEGVTAIRPNERFDVAAEKVEVVDTVGAGDTFNAGFLSGLRQQGALDKSKLRDITQGQLETALKRAVKVAAYVVGQAGANPPRLNQIDL